MIKLMEAFSNAQMEKIITAFADDKTDVGTGKDDTTIEGCDFDYASGSLIYTSKLEVAILKSDNTWQWQGE